MNVDPEIRQWFKDNDVGVSEFLETAWHHYIESDMDTRARIIVNRMQSLHAEEQKLGVQLRQLTGKSLDDYLQADAPLDLKDQETKNLERMWRAMSRDQRAVVKGHHLIGERLSMHQVESWVDARKSDFNLILSTKKVIDRLRNDGFGEVKE